MKTVYKTTLGIVSLLALAGSVSSAQTTITFGGANAWGSIGVNDDVSSTETAQLISDGITFDLGISFAGDNVGIANGGELTEGGRNTWRDGRGPFTFTLSVTDNNLTQDLASLSFVSFTTEGLNNAGEQITVSESASSNTAAIGPSANPQTISSATLYTTNSLTPLTLANVGTWDMIVANTGNNQITGIETFSIEYTLTTVPEPGTYALLAGMAALGFVMLRRR